MKNNIITNFINKSEIAKILKDLSFKINSDYKDKSVVLVGLLKGSIYFISDLSRLLKLDTEITFFKARSYINTESSEELNISLFPDITLKDKHCLLVEDIIDTGYTVAKIIDIISGSGVKSVEIVTLLSKKARRKIDLNIKYIGREIEDYFVVGYGMDYNEKYRNLNYIGVLKDENL